MATDAAWPGASGLGGAGPVPDPANLARIRGKVATALDLFLARQRRVLAGIGEDLLPCLDAAAELLAGGKRLRPAFCYWGWRAAGGPDCPEIYTAAASLELLQASALVHDDVMDASDIRRGRPAVHRQFAARLRAAKAPAAGATQNLGLPPAAGDTDAADQFGDGAAIIIGDMLLAWTDELYRASGFAPEVLLRAQGALDAMRTEVAAGQYLDILNQATRSTSVAAALRVITYKTAKYTIERPLQLGAALAAASRASPSACDTAASDTDSGDTDVSYRDAGNADASETGASTDADAAAVSATCTEYGIPLGIAFQLRDDILGVFGDPARTGKPVSGDISEGKRTVLTALARERASASQAQVLDRYLGDRSLTTDAAAKVKAVLTETGAVQECEALIAASVKEAVSALDGAPITAAARTALAALAITATDRTD
jgi:geranylgeranyl diphosphate synthase, type I